MATKSFINDLVIDTKEDAVAFISALEKAEINKKRKVKVKSRELTDKEEIKKLFKK